MNTRKKIIVVGAGYSGLICALHLARFGRKHYDVTLINTEGVQSLVCEWHWMLRDGKVPFLDFKKVAQKCGVKLRIGRVYQIDPDKKVVTLRGEIAEELTYDQLVLANGQQWLEPKIEGLEAFTALSENLVQRVFSLKSATQILAFRNALHRISWESNGAEKTSRERFIVVLGAGSSGLEFAGELANLRGSDRKARILLVDQKRDLLGDFSPVARRFLKSELGRLRIETILGSPVMRIDEHDVFIENGQILPWDLLLLCTGRSRRSSFLKPFEVGASERGLEVHPNFELKSHRDHYAVGDIAYMPGRGLEKRAQFASQSGEWLANYLIAKAQGIAEGPQFTLGYNPTDFGYLISLGPMGGVGRVGPSLEPNYLKLLSPFLMGPFVDKTKRAVALKYRAQIYRYLLPF